MILSQSIKKFSSKICLIDEIGNKFTYSNIDKESKDICKNLKPRALILVLADNNIFLLKGYISFFEKKMVQMLIDTNIEQKLLNNIINAYKPNYLFI